MVRTLRAAAVVACLFSISAAAEEPDFDGSTGAPMRDSVADFSAARKAGGQVAKPVQPTKQSGKDLYYFSKEEASQARKKFGFRVKETKGFTFDSDVPPAIQKQMLADLEFIKGIKGASATPLHAKIFGAVDGTGYYQFFDSRVTGIGLNSCGGGNAVACVIPFMDPSKMWLTNNFIKFSHPQVARMMVVFHESRHTESQNGNWPHANCPDPFRDAQGKDMKSIWTGASLAGEPACDETPLGSYGSSTIMLKNISKSCSNCTDKVKMDAGLYADDQLGRIIDEGAKKDMQDDFAK